MIKLEALNKTFNTKDGLVTALKDVNLTIPAGRIFGIIGYSGAGKSTLVRCINLLERPTSGHVYFNDTDLTTLNEKQLRLQRRKISMIFQHFNLLAQRNIIRNVMYPLEIAGQSKRAAKQKAKSLLELVGLADKAKAYPSQLSGGQKQRVAIARALATDPEVLLCDEATSALDPNTTDAILDLLKDINAKLGVTIIIITHEMNVIEKICDDVAVVDHGEVVETGAVAQVFVTPQSKMARDLILPKTKLTIDSKDKNVIRIVFDGQASKQPVVAGIALECGIAVNILEAKTTNLGGKAYGQLLLQIPNEPGNKDQVCKFLEKEQINYEEVS